jgi:hypothetical protein
VPRSQNHTRRWQTTLLAASLLCLSLGPCTGLLVTSSIEGAFDGLTRNLVDIARGELGLTPTSSNAANTTPTNNTTSP